MNFYFARQPILDRDQKTVAYEFLYRGDKPALAFTPGMDGSEASSKLLCHIFSSAGLEEVTGGRQAFINFTRSLLLDAMPGHLAPSRVVIELLEDVQVDARLIETCRTLKDQGFTLALDDFVPKKEFEPLLELASIVKIDWRATDRKQIQAICTALAHYDVDLLAEKIESHEEFLAAQDLGFHYFQGFFFARPLLLQSTEIPVASWTALKMLRAVQNPQMDFRQVADILAHDPSLTLRLLKLINSAAFGLRREIASIQHALVLLGESEIRRWFSLLIMARLSADKPKELLVTAYLRGRFGEEVALRTRNGETLASAVFLMGVLSLLDAIMGRPLGEVLSGLALRPDIPEALLRGRGPLAPYLGLMRAYEAAHGQAIERFRRVIKVDSQAVLESYLAAASASRVFFDL